MSYITWTLDLGDLGEQDFDISYKYTPGDPGNVSGPPEKCWPPEASEYEILSIKFNQKLVGWPLDEMLTDALLDSTDFHEQLDEEWASRDRGE